MIKFIETQMQGESHFVINLAIVKKFTKNENFIYIGEKSQISHIEKRLAIPQKKYIRVQQYAKKWQLPFYVFYHFWIILKLLISSNSKDKIVFTSLFPVTHYFIKYFFFLSSAEKYIVLHGELKQIEAYANPLLKILGKFLKYALLNKVRKVRYIVLGENIQEIVESKQWLKSQEIICIEHPYDFDSALEKQSNPGFIKLASIGSASYNKGTHYFIQLAKQNTNTKLKFEIIGAIADPSLKPLLHNKVIFSEQRFLENTFYNQSLSNTDIAVFFLNEKEYAYTASAAFLDAVKYKIPVFAIANNYFKNYFDKYGDVGILFNSYEDLVHFITNEDLNKILQTNLKKWEINFSKIIANNSL